MAINTMVAVKLSIIAESKKAKLEIIQSKTTFCLVFISFFIAENPSKWSIISTIAIAPMRKINISAVLPK